MAKTPKFLIPYADSAIFWKNKIFHDLKMKISNRLFNPHKLRHVLINKLDPGNGMGNYIQCSPLVTALKKASPDVEITFLVTEKPELGIFKLFCFPVNVLALPASQVKREFLNTFAVNILRQTNYDLIVHSHLEDPGLAKIITENGGFKNSIGYYNKSQLGAYPFITMHLPNPGPYEIFPEREFPYDQELQRILDVKVDWQAKLALHRRNEGDCVNELIGRDDINKPKILGIHPGCHINSKGRRWSTESFIQVAIRFKEQFNGRVFVFGGPHEEGDVQFILNKTNDSNIKGVIGQPLLKVAELIDHCDIFISNDSGLMNLSMALGIPSIAICGPSSTKSLHSLYPKGVFLGDKMPCCPCYQTDHYMSCINGPEDSARCLDLITPDEVMEHIEKKLQDDEKD